MSRLLVGSRELAARVLVGGLGLLGLAYGLWLLVGVRDLTSAVVWLAGGVVLHDLVLAPLTVLAGVAVARLLPAVLVGPLSRAAIVLGPLTLLAIPVLGRFGARADNPTLLDRGYVGGWLLVVGLTLLGVAAGSVLGPVFGPVLGSVLARLPGRRRR